MKPKPISVDEFQARLGILCRSGADAAFPRKLRDRHILLRSIVQTLHVAERYSEQALNAELQKWIAEVGDAIAVDHVTLRRYLVDAGYLDRAADGTAYHVRLAGREEVEFDPAVGCVDSVAIVREAREQAALRKRERLSAAASSTDGSDA